MREEYAYLPNFRFMLRVNGINVPLKSVSAFTRENEYEYIQEGGMNDYVYIRRKPISKPYTLRVERYVPTDFDDPLSNGTELLLPLLLFIGKNTGGSMDFGRYYVFTGAVVMSKEYGGLDAERGALLTETVNIGYNQMFCITNPEDATDKPEWVFAEESENGDVTLNASRLYSATPKEPLQNKMNRRAFIAGANKWEFDKKAKGGKGEISHAMYGEEADKAELMGKRRHFSFAANADPAGSAEMGSKRSAQNAAYSASVLGENVGILELSKEEMAEKARKFEVTDDGAYTGNGVISAPKNIEQNKKNKQEFIDGTKKWEMDINKTKDGNGVHNTQNSLVTSKTTAPDGSSIGLGRPELTISQMEAKAKKFEMGETKEEVMGNGVTMATKRTDQNKMTKGEFKTEAVKWKFDGKNKDGTDGSRAKPREAESTRQEAEKKAVRSEFGKVVKPERKKFEGKAKKYVVDPEEEHRQSSKQAAQIKKNNKTKSEFEKGSKKYVVNPARENRESSVQAAQIEENKVPKKSFVDGAKKYLVNPENEEGIESTQSAKIIGENKPEKADFVKGGKKWEMANTKDGAGTSSRWDGGIEEMSKDQMAKKAQRGVKRTIADFLMS